MNRHPRQKDEAHLAFIRQLPCVITGRQDTEAAHIRFGDLTYGKRQVGMGEKPDDKWTVPLSTDAHRNQHSMSERSFWEIHRINPLLVAAFLFIHTGDEEAAMAIIHNARSLNR